MNRVMRSLGLTASVLLLAGTGAAAQAPGVDVAQLEMLCWQNAHTQFEYDLCLMVVHTFLAPSPIEPGPSGTYTPDGPQGGAPAVVEGTPPDDLAPAATASPSAP